MTQPSSAELTAVQAVFHQVYQAMLDADTVALERLLDEDFTLTHITGVVQPRRDWLADIGAGRMRYHTAREISVAVEPHDGTASLVARHVLDATIYGSRSHWPLQLVADLQRRHTHWTIARMVASLYR